MTAEYVLHSTPVWREKANFIINAPVGGGDSRVRFEQLWTRRVDQTSFEVCCIPFYIYDLALGDVVSVDSTEADAYQYSGVIEPSGRYVFRVWLGDLTNDARVAMTLDLKMLPALAEWNTPNLVALDAPDIDKAQELADWLEENEQAGRLAYETGRLS